MEATPDRRGSISQAGSERAAEGLERGLGEMVVVATATGDVDGGARGPGERLDGVLDELERERAGPLAAERQVDDCIRPAAEVDDGPASDFVHRHARVTEPGDPGPVAERLREGRPEDEGHVLDRVVLVDLQIAGGADLEVEQPVVGERPEQVIVEADPGGHARPARPVEVEGQGDRGLARRPLEGHPATRPSGHRRPAERVRRRHRPASPSSASISAAAATSRSSSSLERTVSLR